MNTVERHIAGSAVRDGSVPYRSSPVFDNATLPMALQNAHSTKRGVWGVIRLNEGELRYCIEESGATEILSPARPGLVRPDELHHVELIGPMRMQVDFYDHEPDLVGAN